MFFLNGMHKLYQQYEPKAETKNAINKTKQNKAKQNKQHFNQYKNKAVRSPGTHYTKIARSFIQTNDNLVSFFFSLDCIMSVI